VFLLLVLLVCVAKDYCIPGRVRNILDTAADRRKKGILNLRNYQR